LAINLDVASQGLDLGKVSTPDLEALVEILERSQLNAAQVIESGELRVLDPEVGITRSSPQQRG
jgi:hypothetical protein